MTSVELAKSQASLTRERCLNKNRYHIGVNELLEVFSPRGYN